MGDQNWAGRSPDAGENCQQKNPWGTFVGGGQVGAVEGLPSAIDQCWAEEADELGWPLCVSMCVWVGVCVCWCVWTCGYMSIPWMGGNLSFKTTSFNVRFCLNCHLSFITSMTLGKLLIIGLAVLQFPFLKTGIHSLFNQYWLVPMLFQALL